MMKMDKRKIIYISVAAIIALAALNIYIFTQPQDNKACYKDLCIYADQEPVKTLENLLETSNHSIIIFEGDVNKTNTTAKIIKSTNKMIYALGTKTKITNKSTYGIGLENGKPVDCGNHSLKYCQNIEPKKNELLLKIKYPNHDENRVNIENRTIEIQAKSGEHLLAVTQFLKNRFF